MTCFHPISAFYPAYADNDGKRYLKFGRTRYELGLTSRPFVWMFEEFPVGDNYYEAPYDYPLYFDYQGDINGFNIKVPCGKCIGCRLDYSRMWATRSVNEAEISGYNNCSFVTLTFNNDMLSRRSNPWSLNKVGFRSWIKRLRKAISTKFNKEIRIMACGEYGAKHRRPHYHMLIYGFNFPDKYAYQVRRICNKEVVYYRSYFLEDLWRPAHSSDSFGFSVIGNVNFESSAYVARYCTKKLFGKYAEKVYKDKEPEFLITSRKPGLGFGFLEKFYKNIFDSGYVTLPNFHKAPIPRYYIDKLKEIDENKYNEYRIAQFNKKIDNLFHKDLNSTKERLIVREELKKMQCDRLFRNYEFDTCEDGI